MIRRPFSSLLFPRWRYASESASWPYFWENRGLVCCIWFSVWFVCCRTKMWATGPQEHLSELFFHQLAAFSVHLPAMNASTVSLSHCLAIVPYGKYSLLVFCKIPQKEILFLTKRVLLERVCPLLLYSTNLYLSGIKDCVYRSLSRLLMLSRFRVLES